MDSESLKKEQNLIAIQEEARQWLDKETQADKFISFHEEWVRIKTADISSKKYVNDHNGYVMALGTLQAHQTALDAIQTASERAGRATKELQELYQKNEVD